MTEKPREGQSSERKASQGFDQLKESKGDSL